MPTGLEALIQNLQGAASQSGSEVEEMLREVGRNLMAAQGKSDTARRDFQAGLAAPAEQVNPIAQVLMRTLGLSSEALTGQQGAFKEAQQLIGSQQEQLNQRRTESLKELEIAYRDAAGRAEKLGDMDTSLKFKVKADRAIQDQEKLSGMQRIQAEGQLAAQHRKDAAELEAKLRAGLAEKEFGFSKQLADMKNDASLRETLIREGRDPNDPSGQTLLPASRTSQLVTAQSRGLLSASAWQQALEDAINKSKVLRKGSFGTPDKEFYNTPALRTKLLTIPPPAAFGEAGGDTLMLKYLLGLPDPQDPTKPAFPRETKGPNKGKVVEYWRKRLDEYLDTWFPQ
jgi:hypothetical protein